MLLFLPDLGPRALPERRELAALRDRIQERFDHDDLSAAAAQFVDYWNGAGAFSAMTDDAQQRLASRVGKVLADFEAIGSERLRLAMFRKLQVPTLVVLGNSGPIAPQLIGEALARAMPRGSSMRIPGAGHMLARHARSRLGRGAFHVVGHGSPCASLSGRLRNRPERENHIVLRFGALASKLIEDKTVKHFARVTRVPRRWSILAAATVALACGFGMMTTVAGFIQPLELEFGWGRGDISTAYTTTTIGAACGGLFWGFITDRLDTASHPLRRSCPWSRPASPFAAIEPQGDPKHLLCNGSTGLRLPLHTSPDNCWGLVWRTAGARDRDRDCRRHARAGDHAACSAASAAGHGLASRFLSSGSGLSR